MRILFFIFIFLLPFCGFSQKKKDRKEKGEDKNLNFAALPIITYNRSFGGQFGLMANAYFNLNKKDTLSPASSVALMGNVFTNKTYFTGLFSTFYFNEDRWRTKFGIGLGDIKFQTFYEVPPDIPGVWAEDQNGHFVDYQTFFYFVYLEAARRIVPNFYLGARFAYSSTHTEFDSPLIPDEVLSMTGFGISLEYDNRDNVFFPTHGMNGRLRSMSFLESLGSTTTYHRINFDFNKYFSLSSTSVILARIYAMTSVGDSVPFNGKNVVGRDDLRAYTNGKYRANQVYNIQTEYRWNFYKRWGMVAFGGVAFATDDLKGKNYSGALPALGAGLRFMAIPKRKINFGIDVAVGKDDWGIYFRIGEAFTR